MLGGAVTHQVITRTCLLITWIKSARTTSSLPSTSSEISHS